MTNQEGAPEVRCQACIDRNDGFYGSYAPECPVHNDDGTLRLAALVDAPQPSPTPQADSQPVPDERDDFEKVFPLPSGCIRVGTGYASTGYSNWAAHTHCERWQGWQARAALSLPAEGQEPVEFPEIIMALLREVSDRNGTETRGPWQDGNGNPMQDAADAAIAWICARAAPQPAVAARWQRLITAPADEIVLVAAEFDRPGDWRIKCGYFDKQTTTWRVFGASWEPTHWMPLPPAPSSEGESNG